MMQLLSYLWPPLELKLARRALCTQPVEERWQSALAASRLEVPEVENAVEEAEKLALTVLDSEGKRKDVLESKASSFVVSPTVATALVAAITPLTTALGLPRSIVMVVVVFYGLSLIHLLVSAWYAICVRRVEGFVALSATNAVSLLRLGKLERAEHLLAYARENEPTLTIKSNRLTVAEDLFLRGLAFLAAGAVVALGALLLAINT